MADVDPPPVGRIIPAVLTASALGGDLAAPGMHTVPAWRRAWNLLMAEARLLHPAVWAASFAVMAVCAVFSLLKGSMAAAALGAPLVAGLGVAGLYGPERDQAFEVVAATPTSPRVLLLARVTLVFGYDLALASLAAGLIAVAGVPTGGVAGLVLSWLGPMALLAALSLLLSVWWHPNGAIGVALAVWSIPAMDAAGVAMRGTYSTVWSSGPWTIAVAAVLGLVAFVLADRREPLRR
ncbi:hypothetical protein [Herbidospora mongoliensis]|uniref:hypothetical protein n=1 Tax=Herbidospora mongoliensis TaxID=688067 RepID=UPI00082C539E|nr:hypothetical protein [Herbidospora mongoliensis]